MKPGEERRIREYFPVNYESPVAFEIINEGTTDQKLIAIPSVDLSEGLSLFFRAEIGYRGPSSKGHKTGANWLYRPPWDLVTRLDEYNTTTTISKPSPDERSDIRVLYVERSRASPGCNLFTASAMLS
jgi:hypothetical protein